MTLKKIPTVVEKFNEDNNLEEIYWCLGKEKYFATCVPFWALQNIHTPLNSYNLLPDVGYGVLKKEFQWFSSDELIFNCKLDKNGLPHGICAVLPHFQWHNKDPISSSLDRTFQVTLEILAEGYFKHGLLDGSWTLYYDLYDPSVAAHINFKDGVLHGPIEVFDTTKFDLLFLKGNYFKGKKDGLFECFSREELELSEEEEDKYYEERDFKNFYKTKIYKVHYQNGRLKNDSKTS